MIERRFAGGECLGGADGQAEMEHAVIERRGGSRFRREQPEVQEYRDRNDRSRVLKGLWVLEVFEIVNCVLETGTGTRRTLRT